MATFFFFLFFVSNLLWPATFEYNKNELPEIRSHTWMCGNVPLLYMCRMLTLTCCAHWVTDQYLPVDHTLSSTALVNQEIIRLSGS